MNLPPLSVADRIGILRGKARQLREWSVEERPFSDQRANEYERDATRVEDEIKRLEEPERSATR